MKYVTQALVFAAVLIPAAALANGNTVHVANNGIDSATCGSAESPCRSINRGIIQAQEGDTVLVRPGRYGDFDGDGVLEILGEEWGGQAPGSQGAVYVNKRVTILSTAGAEDTVIDAGGATQAVVHIAADGVQFGDNNAGFTLTSGQSYGLYSAFATDVVIAGNTARNSTFGFFLDSSGVIEARRNLATQNSAAGFILFGRTPTSYVWLHHSRSLANADGVSVSANPHRVNANSLADNAFTGVNATHGAARVTNNYITNNRDGVMVNGFDTNNPPGAGPVFSHNSIIGNRNNGLYVLGTPPGGKVVARQNNIFGNYNCGLGTFQANVDVRNSFWGAPTGPSFTQPADFICADPSSTVFSTPFSATEIPVGN